MLLLKLLAARKGLLLLLMADSLEDRLVHQAHRQTVRSNFDTCRNYKRDPIRSDPFLVLGKCPTANYQLRPVFSGVKL